jgi:hypothetical protein
MKAKIDEKVIPELVAAAQIAGQPTTNFWDEVAAELDEIDSESGLVEKRPEGTV